MTDTVRIKTEELVDKALRYAVAVATRPVDHNSDLNMWFVRNPVGRDMEIDPSGCELNPWQPDRDWSQLGPLKQQFLCNTRYRDGYVWAICRNSKEMTGPDELIASCRAIAAAHFGDYADVPRELVEGT